MKIVLLTLGTRGDIQPYAVLGQALKERGHQVTLSTAKNFESLVLSYGINFYPVEADFQAILDSEEGKKMIKGNPFTIRRNLHTWIYPLITNSLTEFYNLAKESDLVLYHVKTLADSFADQFSQKMIRASVLPIVEPTLEFPNPSFSGLPLPSFLNRFSYQISNMSIRLLSKPIRKFRTDCGLPKNFEQKPVPNLYGISPNFLPVPKDYSNPSSFTGFWFGNSQEDLSTDLLEFIKKGKPPLLLTFGSMPFKTNFDLQSAIIKLTEEFQTRIIVVKGWGWDKIEKLIENPNVKIIDSAPYEKLFPLTKAIIHHGGIGTTAECLRAGKPFFVCPILHPMGDQKFWGEQGYKKKLAVKPIPLTKLTEKKFIIRIKELLTNRELYENARKMKMQIETENGLQNTVEKIEKIAMKS